MSINIKIDDINFIVEENSLLIDILLKNNIEIPHFCYHEALGADGNCRMCMVEIAGQKRPQIACDTFAKEGMEVFTKTASIYAVRQDILELELINHPIDCPTCDQAGECKLQDYYMEYGSYQSVMNPSDKIKHNKHQDLGSNVILDQERCVLCARCTRFTTDITKTNELGIIGRGDEARVTTMPNKKLDNPYAMNIVDLCPVGALTSKDFRFSQRSWFLTSSPSVCQGCDKGCNIFIDHNKLKYQDDKIYRFKPRYNEKINGYFICDEGRLSYKNLQENREYNLLLNGKVINKNLALEHLLSKIEEYKNDITILVDANLYNEEMEAINSYALSIGANIFSPLSSYMDNNFGDSWLKSSMRASNAKGIKSLKIDTEVPSDYKTGLLINFNHLNPQLISYSELIEFNTHIREEENLNLIFPLAVSSESEGTLINKNNISQYCEKVIYKNTPIPTVLDWISDIAGDKIL
ncbi:NADH-ubiquinone oxidoreductase chain G [hydrothermal vent metagenome]|uniref:NADH-ubiquinone oxidoreductase chain G n=1 Tax=hydrothermal vent metagenome TaxID=652676 RepID=A0A1W1C051_9ZZZZ